MTKLIECPRDAMQGLKRYIPAPVKAEYINLLLKVGFDTIDFGSFVSPKAIPQMKDSAEVLELLDIGSSDTRLLAIVANERGIFEAVKHKNIHYLGFPLSISETFQQRNTNSGIEDSMTTVRKLLDACAESEKESVIYLSMAFGNPYGDVWNNDVAEQRTEALVRCGARIIALSDTTGVSTPDKITYLLSHLSSTFPETEFGLHLHSTPDSSQAKITAAWESGCRRFDSALGGFGGCPMASDTLTGNIATESLVSALETKPEFPNLDQAALERARRFAPKIFS